MVRYKRYRKYRRNSTNVIKMKFQSFMDISTQAGQMQIISISAGGQNLLKRLPAQFSAYKYYKIGNISVKLVPASTLPVDPTGLSIAAGDNLVDPRDQLTPGMMRITNGEDVLEDLGSMSAADQHTLYNSMLLDPRWYKWMLQSGVKRHATPRYWQIGQLHQDKWPGATMNIPNIVSGSVTGTATREVYSNATESASSVASSVLNQFDFPNSSDLGIFQVGHRGVLGWLPTDGMQFGSPMLASPPEVEVMKICLPPAYKTRYWYRMFISETVYFREPLLQAPGTAEFPFRPIDVFHSSAGGNPIMPTTQYANTTYATDEKTGGNYGDD